MNRTFRNFWIDIILFVLLGLNIALISLTPRSPTGIHAGLGWHAHALISILLTFVCLVHVILHWRWFLAVLSGKAKGRIKLIMNSLVVVTMLAANLSGHAGLASNAASRMHNAIGTFAMIGLFVHGIKHARWMVMMAKSLTGDRHVLQQMPSSE